MTSRWRRSFGGARCCGCVSLKSIGVTLRKQIGRQYLLGSRANYGSSRPCAKPGSSRRSRGTTRATFCSRSLAGLSRRVTAGLCSNSTSDGAPSAKVRAWGGRCLLHQGDMPRRVRASAAAHRCDGRASVLLCARDDRARDTHRSQAGNRAQLSGAEDEDRNQVRDRRGVISFAALIRLDSEESEG